MLTNRQKDLSLPKKRHLFERSVFGIRLPASMKLQKVKDELIKKKIYVLYRGDAMRISPNIYNTKDDLKKLSKVLISLLQSCDLKFAV